VPEKNPESRKTVVVVVVVCFWAQVKFLKTMEGAAMVQMGDQEACDRIIHNLHGVSCFGKKLSIRLVVSAIHLLHSCASLLHCYTF